MKSEKYGENGWRNKQNLLLLIQMTNKQDLEKKKKKRKEKKNALFYPFPKTRN